jgi:hypothetical protein
MAVTVTWDDFFETTPAGTDSPTAGDNIIRELKKATRERMEQEHIAGTTDATASHGIHRRGSAIAYLTNAAPTLRPGGGAISGTTDYGRLWFNSSQANLPYVRDASGWTGFMRVFPRVSIQGTLAVDTNIVPPIIFPRSATIRKVSARVGTAPTTNAILIDINKNGTDSIFSGVTRITIDAAETNDAVTSFNSMNADLADDDYLTVDIDQVGGSSPGADLSISIEATLD